MNLPTTHYSHVSLWSAVKSNPTYTLCLQMCAAKAVVMFIEVCSYVSIEMTV
jgi:hypothetical protein